jgi:hypothetical protein
MKQLCAFLLAFVFAQLCTAQSFGTQRQMNVEKYLHAVEAAKPFIEGVAREKERAGRTTPFIEFVLAADVVVIERHMARIYARYLTDQEAEIAAVFYGSEAGRYITEMQKLQPNSRRTPMYLPPEHAEPYRRFVATGTEKVLEVLTSDRRVWMEIGSELERAQQR